DFRRVLFRSSPELGFWPATTFGRFVLPPELRAIERPLSSVEIALKCQPPSTNRFTGWPCLANGSSHRAVNTRRCGTSSIPLERSARRLYQLIILTSFVPPGRTPIHFKPRRQ